MSKNEPLKEDAAKPAAEKASEQTHLKPGADDLHKKVGELSDQMLRLSAEFDNYKKRTLKEKEQLAHSSEARLMLRMIPVYEEIELAQHEVGKLPEGELKKGVLLVLGKLKGSFEKEGLQEMKLDGEKFDPFKHETAMREESDKPEGTILKVIQKGYAFRGEILRHAIVSISAGKKQDDEESETKSGQGGKQAANE